LNIILPDRLLTTFTIVQDVLAAAPLDFLIGLADVNFLSAEHAATFAAYYFTAEGVSIPVFL
jgi:hypothetical protein